jgi:hypothetical protein
MPKEFQDAAKTSRRRPLLNGRQIKSQLRGLRSLGLNPTAYRLNPDEFGVIFKNNAIAEPAETPDAPNEIDELLKKSRARSFK